MKAIKKTFKLINRVLDGIFAVADEACNWTDELVKESKAARDELEADRKAETTI